METQKYFQTGEGLDVGRFKIGDTVTIKDDFDGNRSFLGQIGSIVAFGVENADPRDPSRCIWVNLPNVKDFLFRSYHDYNIPQEKKKWVAFSVSELRLGRKPQTQQEIVDELVEKSQAHSACILYEPADHTCLVEGCANFATGYGVYNSWGTGHVFHACRWHIDEYTRWCDDSPFKPKTEGLVHPPWLPKVEKINT